MNINVYVPTYHFANVTSFGYALINNHIMVLLIITKQFFFLLP